MKTTSILLILGCVLVSSPSTRAQDAGGSIQCRIDGMSHTFAVQAHAVLTEKGGLELFAFTDFRNKAAAIAITVPSPQVGTFTLQNRKTLTVHYSRSTFSSRSGDHLDARREVAGTAIGITIKKLGQVGDTVEGSFWAVVANGAQQRVSLTNGTFRLVRAAADSNPRGE